MSQNSASPELPELDISPLGKALKQFQIALDARSAAPSDELIRDAVIQRFEFTYELSIRMLRRYIRLYAASNTGIDDMTFKELIQQAVDLRLIQGGILDWLDFRQARTDTVHTYNAIRAEEVASTARTFAEEAKALFDNLSEGLQR